MPIPLASEEDRSVFGGTDNDFLFRRVAGGLVQMQGGYLTYWDTETGGTQYTDLRLDGEPTSVIAADKDGYYPPFLGPVGVTQMWAESSVSGRRTLVVAVRDLAAKVTAIVDDAFAAANSIQRDVPNGVAPLDANQRLPFDRAPLAFTANRPVNLRDNTALDFTGATDSAAALQTALTANQGRRIELGREGALRLDSGITGSDFTSLVGLGHYVGAGGAAPCELRFPNLTGSAVGITGGGAFTLENIFLRGPGATVGTVTGFKSTAGSPQFKNVTAAAWPVSADISNAYYTVLDRFVSERSKYGLVTSGCYNLVLNEPRFYCAYGTGDATLGYGIAGAARGMTIDKGSFEGYETAVRVRSGQSLTMDGTYFEVAQTNTTSVGVDAGATDNVALNLRGFTAYLNSHRRFVDLASATDVTIHSKGHKFNCGTGSTSTPSAYYMNAADVATPGNIRGSIGEDDWSEVLKAGVTYVPGPIAALGELPSVTVRIPGVQYLGGDVAGNGSPEGVVSGRVGQIYRRLDGGAGTTLYVKPSGAGTNTGWAAK